MKLLVFSSPRALPSKDRVDADAGEGMCQEPSGQQSAGSAQLSGALPRPGAGKSGAAVLGGWRWEGKGR